jgi:LysR family transcriptional regulator, glycine cleavage system transcriptional activator
MRRLPPLGAIQAFVHVARLGSLKAAADTLALSSPALTRRIQALEEFLETPLFERQHNSMLLNSQGEIFLAEVAPHVEALSAAVDRVSAPARGMRLRIAVPSLFASQRLVQALASLRARHPNLQIDVDTGANRLGRLNEGLDAVIAIASEVDAKLYSRILEKGRVVAIGSRSFREGETALLQPSDIARVPILLHRDMPKNFDVWRQAVGLPGLEPTSVSYYDAGQLILDAAAEGLGVAFMLGSHLSCSTDDRLVQIFDQTVESPYAYWFACSPDALSRRAVRAFHDWLFDTFKSE